MPAACTRICTSSSTGSPISISSMRNGVFSSHSRAPLVFMPGNDRTRYRNDDNHGVELQLYSLDVVECRDWSRLWIKSVTNPDTRRSCRAPPSPLRHEYASIPGHRGRGGGPLHPQNVGESQ